MKIAITEDQVIRLKTKLQKEGINEDVLDDLLTKGANVVKKGYETVKDFISGLDVPIEKKSADETGKADFVSADVDKFYEILKTIDNPISQQKYGQMKRQQQVEAVQIALQLLGYQLKRYGTDGLFGPETAAAVNKYKTDRNILDDDTSVDLHEESLIVPIPITSDIKHGFNEKRGNRTHGGIDIAAKVGTPIKSIANGKITAAGSLDSRCGDGVVITHADGLVSSYCHLSSVRATVGNIVNQGDIIGLTGGAVGASGSGNSKGPHLHLTLKKDGQRVDPMQYFGSSIGTYYDDGKSSSMIGGATITPEMAKELIDDVKAKNITNQDLEKYVDRAVTTGGSADFIDLDLNNPADVDAYEKIADNYIKQREPNAKVTGTMMASSAERVFKKYGKYVPPELALAQAALEGGLLSDINARPIKTKNPFNVGNTDNPYKDNPQPSFEAGVDLYYDLIARRYLVKGKTAADLVNDFKNDQGNHYATAGEYEVGLKDVINSVRKRSQNVYASLAQRKAENLAESLLLEADKRQAIKNAFGFNDAWAEEFHRMSDKLSVWIASTFVKKMVDSYGSQAPSGDDPQQFTVSYLNTLSPNSASATYIWTNEYKPKYEYIMHWIRAPRREQLNIRDLSFDAAYQLAEEWHESLQVRKQSNYQETGDVFIDYRNSDGVGYYWVHLNKSYCDAEADRMGHCARSRTGQLISFRRINDFGEGESYLTVDYRPGGIIGDFHRHGNKKPTNRFHRQIVDFLTNTRYPVSALTKQDVHRYEDNFHLSDLSAADLKRVYDANPALRYNINDENTWPEIIDAILAGELNFAQYSAGIKLKLYKKSKSLRKDGEILPLFNDEVIKSIIQNMDELANNEKTIFMENFGNKMIEVLKNNLDSKFESSPDEAKSMFIDSLRGISQDLFDQYLNLCPYIDYGFKLFDEASRIEIVASRGIKRSLFTCTDTIPFLSRYVDNTPTDVNGNIAVKTEEGLWGLIKQNGETILHPRFSAIAPNPIDRGKTYMVRNINGEFYKLNPADMSTVKLEKKR